MKIGLQNIETNMANTIKAVIADAITPVSRKQTPTIVVNQDYSERSNQQALESKREIESIQNQLGKQSSSRPTYLRHEEIDKSK